MGSKKKSNKERNAARNARKKLQNSDSPSPPLANVTPSSTDDVEYVVEDLKVDGAFVGEDFEKFKVDFKKEEEKQEEVRDSPVKKI